MKKIILSSLLILPFLSLAATQGNLVTGPTKSIQSQGSFDVSIRANYVIQVNGLNDMDFGDHDLSTSARELNERFCVFTNADSFDITFFSSNQVAGQPYLANTTIPTEKIPYQFIFGKVDFNGIKYGTSSISSGQTITGIDELRKRKDCRVNRGAGVQYYPNVVITARIDGNDVLGVLPGSYLDVVTVIARPE